MYLDFSDESMETDVKEMTHVGRTGSFVPVLSDGAALWRIKDGKKYAVTGTKGYRWIERQMALGRDPLDVDMSYFDHLRHDAFDAIDYYGSFHRFVE
jgi:hypothetical protein